MNKLKVFLVIVIGVGVFLCSCGQEQSAGSVSTATILAASNVAVPKDIATATLRNTSTHQPTLTSTSAPTLTPTKVPIPTKPPHENPGYIVTLGQTGKGWPTIPGFSPDGKILALASQKVKLWDLSTLELVHELATPYSDCYTENISFSDDSSLLGVSIYCVSDPDEVGGHLLVWETQSGVLLHDWEQPFSKNTSEIDGKSNSNPVPGFAFLPGTPRLAFANGNTIEIRDVRQDADNPLVLNLGDNMFASDIYISKDGKRLFAFMDFNYLDYTRRPVDILQQYALETWNIESQSLLQKNEFTVQNTGNFSSHDDEEMNLAGSFFTHINYISQVLNVTDLETGESRMLPYQDSKEYYISSDANFAVYFPTIFELNGYDCNDASVELLNTNTGQILYTFQTPRNAFLENWCYAPHTILFNADNTLVAIGADERVSLWDISNAVKNSTFP